MMTRGGGVAVAVALLAGGEDENEDVGIVGTRGVVREGRRGMRYEVLKGYIPHSSPIRVQFIYYLLG